jgi:hypothetical protein
VALAPSPLREGHECLYNHQGELVLALHQLSSGHKETYGTWESYVTTAEARNRIAHASSTMRIVRER